MGDAFGTGTFSQLVQPPGGQQPQQPGIPGAFQGLQAPSFFQSPQQQAQTLQDQAGGLSGERFAGRGAAAIAQGQSALRRELRGAQEQVERGLGQSTQRIEDIIADIQTRSQEGLTEREGLLGFVQSGEAAVQELQALTGLSGESQRQAALQNLQNSPQFQFRLQEGIEAIERSAAAKGLLGSGRVLEEITEFASNLAQESANERIAILQQLGIGGQEAAAHLASLTAQEEQFQTELQAQLGQQAAQFEQQAAQQKAALQQSFSGQISTLQSQLSAQRQQLEVERARLTQSQLQFEQQLAAEQARLAQSQSQFEAQLQAERDKLAQQSTQFQQQFEAQRQQEIQNLQNQLTEFQTTYSQIFSQASNFTPHPGLVETYKQLRQQVINAGGDPGPDLLPQ